jgi:Late exocytosis, associated with Golgi transport/Cytosolic domain of 10TM putative phosphate transporter
METRTRACSWGIIQQPSGVDDVRASIVLFSVSPYSSIRLSARNWSRLSPLPDSFDLAPPVGINPLVQQTPLANDQYGCIRWIWRLWLIPDDEIRDQCGLDSLCFLRVLRMGLRMSVVGMLNAVWLLPLYCTAGSEANSEASVDGIIRATVANVPSGSKRLAGTVLAAYILIGFTMHLILRELQWFSRQRHAFLSSMSPRNYSVYVRNIPQYCISNEAVEEYFRHGFPTSVLQALLRVKAPNLARLVSKRDALVSKLEHAVSWERKSGRTLTHRPTSSMFSLSRSTGGDSSRRVNTVEHYSSELSALNQTVTERIDAISSGSMRQSSGRSTMMQKDEEQGLGLRGAWCGRRQPLLNSASEAANLGITPPDSFNTNNSAGDDERVPLSPSHDDRAENGDADEPNQSSGRGGALQSLVTVAKSRALSAAAVPLQAATSILHGPTEGEPYTAGFVTFTRLSAVHASLQMVQNEEPFAMQVVEAPDPDDGAFPSACVKPSSDPAR